jgi:hypothetical protein
MSFIYILVILFGATYAASYTSILYTESFILFLAFFTIFIYVVGNTSYKVNYSKEDFRWNLIIKYYIALKNWNRYHVRDRNVKIFKFLDLAIQIRKYETKWLKININRRKEKDIEYLNTITLKRLEILKHYKKSKIANNPLQYFTFSDFN